jgi:hypothetical protein
MSKMSETNMTTNASMNQASQCTPLFNPIIFMTSFNLISFSYTIFLHIMATVSTHAKIMNSGRYQEMATINLNTK